MPEPVSTLERLKSAAPTISVGVITADLSSLGNDVRIIEDAGVQVVHFDVMDGCFCPMMTVGPPFIGAVKTPMLKDVHLMIDAPLDKLESYVKAGADMISVHVEACAHPHRVLQALGRMENANHPSSGIARGVALNPGTPLCAIEPLLAEVDVVWLLAVNPGWGGQKFIASTEERTTRLIRMIGASGRDILLGIDGGIKRDNIADVARMGADIIVTGSAVFDGKDPAGNVRFMLDQIALATGRSKLSS